MTTAELMPVHTAEVQTGLVLGVRLDAGGTATGENPVPFKSGRYVPNPPGGPQSSQAFHYDMAASATPLGEGYVAVHGSSYEVRYLNAEGVLTGVSRVTRAREPVTEKIHEELEAYYRARAARAGGNVEASGLSWVMSRPFPDSLPAYNTVLVDPEGRVWAGYVASSLHERASTFDVFQSSGEFIGALDLPVGARLLDVAGVHVLIVVTDELGVQRVQVVPMPVALRPSV